ncbi:MAG: DUF4065 domain-containing protein [Bacteroidales bacterium]|nr:DUF4065 domain-containing protein [Bacteroidales bacterium]
MYAVNDIADLIITTIKCDDDNASLINLKLQKLLYYLQAWSYGINKKPFFDGEFEAWVHGPVNRVIFNRFNPQKTLYSEIQLSDRIKTDFKLENDDDEEFFEFIMENYAKYTGAQLENLSHQEQPWISARGNKNRYEKSDTVISAKSMMDYYGEKWQKING